MPAGERRRATSSGPPPSNVDAARRGSSRSSQQRPASTARSQQISLDMLEWADKVLAMDASVLATLRAVCGPKNENKLRLYLGDRDVPDPMSQDDAAFHECAVLIEAGTALHTSGRIT
ncbi:hypothetical protein [Streptomyces nitrosporeus]|uniref:arsenate reductase/protein-tyrosine-phosphatase family protein n=1 Tax=Streptomyces nitrosporeus TaxID=28894 RepID=UPI0033255DC5